jgi:RING finger protein 170
MAPPKTTARAISQEAFNELVNENINDLEMDPTEALQDAIQTLTLQGVDLSGHSLDTLLFHFSHHDPKIRF